MPKTENGHGSNTRITKKVSAALDHLIDGSAKTDTDAARKAGMHHETLRRALRKPHVIAEVRQRIDQRLGGLALSKAAARLIHLIDQADSEYVQLDASKHVLAIGGVKPKSDGLPAGGGGGISLNITFKHVVQGSIGAPSVQPQIVDAQVIDDEGSTRPERVLAEALPEPDEGGTGSKR